MRWLLLSAVVIGVYLWLGRSDYVGELDPQGRYTYPGYEIEDLESFQLSARLLSKRAYATGREAELSPLDLAVAWGPMAVNEKSNQLQVSQRNRWFYWRAEQLPLPRSQLESSMANIHIIPATEVVAQAVDSLPVGAMIELEGKLVEVRGSDGWRWRSSLSRFDTGDKSCELLVLQKVVVLSVDS